MENEPDVVMVPAISLPGLFFLFREDGDQLVITLRENKWHSDRGLTETEVKFINKYLLKND